MSIKYACMHVFVFAVYIVNNYLLTKNKPIYNAISQNNREIDRAHKNELYIATVSINQKAVDSIKAALRFGFNAT